MALHRFYWMIDGALAGCSRPGGLRPTDRAGRGAEADQADPALADDLAWLRREGIGALLSLTETALPTGALAACGLVGLHLPVEDFQAPSPAQFDQALAFIDEQRARGQAVAVHCRMGQGRTGAVLAAYLIRGGLGAASAIGQVRRLCPGAIGSPTQTEALAAFAARGDWLL